MVAPKVVAVTGASRGIGLAIAKYLIQASHNVVLVSRNTTELESLKVQHPAQVACLAVDLTKADAAPKVTELAVRTFGRLDGLIINHGVLEPLKRVADADIDEWKQVKAAIPLLRESKGKIVFTSSGAALKGYAAWGAYGGSKAALNSLSQHIAVEEPDLVSVAIGPGRVDTDMQKILREQGQAVMAEKDYAGFKTAFEEGLLNKPEWPAKVIARLSVEATPDLSGKYLSWDSEPLASYRN